MSLKHVVKPPVVLSTVPSTCEEIAAALQVPIGAIFVAIEDSDGKLCKGKEGLPCPYGMVALVGNYTCCAACKQGWYPKPSETGGLLLGPKYMRHYGSRHLCCCGIQICNSIGYLDGTGYTKLPPDTDLRQQYFNALGIFAPRATDMAHPMYKEPKNYSVAMWHFDPRHRKLNPRTELFELVEPLDSYRDDEGKLWSCKPPNYHPSKYIEEVSEKLHPANRAFQEPARMPSHFSRLADKVRETLGFSPPPASKIKAHTIAGTPLSSEKPATLAARAKEEHRRAEILEDHCLRQSELLQENGFTTLSSMLDALKASRTELSACKAELYARETECTRLRLEVSDLSSRVSALSNMRKGAHRHITFLDFTHDDEAVSTFFNFSTFKAVNMFLNLINLKHNESDPGICTRLRRFSKAASENVDRKRVFKPRSQCRSLDFKTECMIYSFFVKGGLSYRQIRFFTGASHSLISDIVRTWAVFLDKSFARIFPVPTKDQILQNYPEHYIETYGHARLSWIADATDQRTERPSYLHANSSMYSVYQGDTGVKTCVCTDIIGYTPNPGVSDSFGSAITDPNIFDKMGFANCMAPGEGIQVDKGFLIENCCAKVGVFVERPVVFKRGQKKQARESSDKMKRNARGRITVE